MKILNALIFKGEIEMDVNTIDSMTPWFFLFLKGGGGDGQTMDISFNISYIINTSKRNL